MATEQDYWNQMYANACDQNEVLSLRQQLAAAQEALENEQAKGIHSCHANCTIDGCVNRKLRQQLADSQKREVMLRGVLGYWMFFIDSEQDDEQQAPWVQKAQKALAATADLDGLILCHAEPIWVSEDTCEGQMVEGRLRKVFWECNKNVGTPLYRAWEPK